MRGSVVLNLLVTFFCILYIVTSFVHIILYILKRDVFILESDVSKIINFRIMKQQSRFVLGQLRYGVVVLTEGYYPYLPNPSARAGYDTRSILKRSLAGLNSEFSFS